MNENIKRTIEKLTRNCNQEDKAIILQIVTPGEPGTNKNIEVDFENGQFERIEPILEEILAAISEEEKRINKVLKTRYKENIKEKLEDQEERYKTRAAKFKKQLEKARVFTEKNNKTGLLFEKGRYLYELEQTKEWEGIINAFNYGYMMGYQKAQHEAQKIEKR